MHKKITLLSTLAILWPITVFANPLLEIAPSNNPVEVYSPYNSSITPSDPYFFYNDQSLGQMISDDPNTAVWTK